MGQSFYRVVYNICQFVHETFSTGICGIWNAKAKIQFADQGVVFENKIIKLWFILGVRGRAQIT